MGDARNYVEEYEYLIRSGEINACEKIKAVYEREVSFMHNPPKDFPYYFDPELGNRHIEFMETFCRQSKTPFAGQNIHFELFQRAKMQLVFGWRRKDNNLRRFREVDDVRARKNGKSTETAAVEWDVAVNDGEMGGEIYCTANKKDQAKLIFDECVSMRLQSPELKAISKKRQSDIYIPLMMTTIKALAADTSTMDGLNSSFFSLDEFHEQKNRKLYDVMIQSQAARLQPLAWLISTNGFIREGFFDEVYDYASNVAMWIPGYEDYTLLPLLYELDEREEWHDPHAWIKANPGLGSIKRISTLAENVQKAERDSSFLPTLLTKDFDLKENSEDLWLASDEVVNDERIDLEKLRNSYAIGGCDLSSTTDLTCASLIIRKPNDKRFYVLQKYFLPRSRVEKVSLKDKREAPYQKWAERGYLTVCQGATVNFHDVTEWFVMMVKEYNIRPLWIGYDAALSGYWREEMEAYGFDMEKIRQGPFTWTYPMKELKGLFADHRIIYDANPVLRWCLYNTAVKSLNKNGIESIQPVKTSEARRIDGQVSLLNAYTCFKNHEEEYMRYIK